MTNERLPGSRRLTEITQILFRIQQGDQSAADELWPFVYDELRKLANYKIRSESRKALNPTELVHEAYLRLVDVEQVQYWSSRSHFFAAAAEAMRRILVDVARSRASIKRGGDAIRFDLNEDLAVTDDPLHLILCVNEALTILEETDPIGASIVKLRYFSGMSHQETATALGLSRRVADRHWVVARTRLYKLLHDPPKPSDG